MSYEIRKGKHGFRVLEVWYDPKKRVKAIPREAYAAIGFDPKMTLTDAKLRASQLNQQAFLDRRKIAQAARRVEHKKKVECAYLPAHWLEAFDQRIEEETAGSATRLRTIKMQWSTAQDIIAHLELDPKDFHGRKMAFYKEFQRRTFSVDYSNQLIRLLNLWGKFVAQSTNQFFEPIPKLKGIHKQNIVKARQGKRGVRRKSKGLTPEILLGLRDTFKHNNLEQQWNWLFVAFAFGLRPEETDNLKLGPEGYRIEHDPDRNLEVIWVYQTKLTSVDEAERWKPIPAYFREQREALVMIRDGAAMKRPLTKTIKRWIGDPYDNYSPRKGFTDWMLDNGFTVEDCAVFLGHRDMKTTWQHYKDKQRFKLPKKAS
ncbi:MAG: hypothetical protein NDI61_01880 [Bdellovibrionaceae bacterium]|nr:hypothetical protein [Pseudobdellovibrionaceae bacterium]